jgi:hypothetical protein
MIKRNVSLDDVFNFVLDRALEESTFCSVKNVADEFGINKDKSRDFLNSLTEDGRLTVVYENPQIKVYAPKEVIQQIVRVRKKPKWVENHLLPNKEKHVRKKKGLDKALYEYERFEELLYLKKTILEEPVMFAFEWLGFKAKPLPKGSYADFELMKNDFLAVVEVSGGNGSCSMEEIRQVIHYHLDELAKSRQIPNLMVLFNHYCDKDLEERGEPFEPNIRVAGQKHGIALVTTTQLYEKIRRVKSGELNKEQVAKEIMEGKWN